MTHTDFLSLERQAHIVKLVTERGRLMVSELSQMFDVSDATIRRDLSELDTMCPGERRPGGGPLALGISKAVDLSEGSIRDRASS